MMFFSSKTMAFAAASALLIPAPALAENAPVAKPAKEKVICKTETVVGSLIPGPRRCHTRAQWEEHAVAGQAIARKLVEDGTGRISSN